MYPERTPDRVLTLRFRDTSQRMWEFLPVEGERGIIGGALESDAPEPAQVRTIFVVHGFRGNHHGLDRLIAALPQYRILIPDLPGFGESEPFDGPHDVQSYVDFVLWCADNLDLGANPVLLGHSFGSIVAAHAIARGDEHPFSALVLLNPISEPPLRSRNAVGARAAQLYYWLGAKLPESAGMSLLSNPGIVRIMSVMMAKARNPDLRRYIHGQHAQYFSDFANRQVVLESFNASVSHDVSEVAGELNIPTLLIAGDKDDLGSVETQKALAGNIAESTLRVISGAGHLVHYETPMLAAVMIDEFLDAPQQGATHMEGHATR